jgi:multisubunit Na+/H+ antiporter MnhE subunit
VKPGTGLTGAVRAWVIWWVLSAALWLALVDRTPPATLVMGAVVAAIAATGAVLVRRQRRVVTRVRAGWWMRALRTALGLVTDLPLLVVVLWRRGVLRRDEHGEIVESPFASTDLDDPVQGGDRAAAEAIGSLAPSSVVVDVDVERGVIVEHRLKGSSS